MIGEKIMTSGAVGKIEKRLETLDPESLRYRALKALRNFRASWVELGRLLNEVVYGGDYKEWGYDDFELYCARELGLKKPTVQKLMASYNYMRKYETKRLHDFEDSHDESVGATIPDYQTVELLDRVRRREDLSEDDVKELHHKAFSEEAEEKELRKEIRQRLRPAIEESEISDRATARKQELSQILRVARELRRRLSNSKAIPGGLKERIEQTLIELETLD